MQIIIFALINLARRLRNGWRRLWRPRGAWVRIELSGDLPEFADEPPWWQRRLMGAEAPLSLSALRGRLRQIADTPHTEGVLLVVRDLSAGWATLQSLHAILGDFRARDRQLVAYLLAFDPRAYLAACAAQRILMPPSAQLSLVGVRVEAQFLADTLRMAGLEAEVVAVSPYKSGGDQLARATISPEAYAQLERLTDQRYAMLVETIAAARSLDPAQVRDLIDRAPLSAAATVAGGLIDALRYEDELAHELARRSDSPAPAAPQADPPAAPAQALIWEWATAARRLRLPYLRRQRRYVGVVSVQGTIAQGDSRRSPLPLPLIGGSMAGSDSVIQALRHAERDKRLAALVLHVDSPGGDSFASDLIWREVERLGRAKPVVVSMGNLAASGGYYIAAPARAIVAQPATLTGSIGVFALRPNAAGLLERAAVGTSVISRGANSGIFSPLQPLTDSERAALTQTVATIYADFKERVQRGRRLSAEQIDPIAGGRVWSGQEAAERGLVDRLGGLPAAVAHARSLAGLPEDPTAPIVRYRGARASLPPLPFPPAPAALVDIPALLAEAAQTRIMAALPFIER